jgi:hypothetical protein
VPKRKPDVGTVPQFDHLVAPDYEPKYGKPGGKIRTFTMLPGSFPTLVEVFNTGSTASWTPVDPQPRYDDMDAFVEANGQWDDTRA